MLLITIVWKEQWGADRNSETQSQSTKCHDHHDGGNIFYHSFGEEWWGPNRSEAEKGEEGKQISGEHAGWTEEAARAEGEAWLTLLECTGQRREKSSSVQRSSPWPLLWLVLWVRTVPFPRALQGQRPSAPAIMKQAWSEIIHFSWLPWLLELILWVCVAENINSNF